jgi:divalent metal cation (Fe/Co/Zn/Cd) transporter
MIDTEMSCDLAEIAFTVYAAISSLSLALLATGIDSIFDIGSNILLFWLHKKALKLNVNKWPVGGARLETIGNIIYGELELYCRVAPTQTCFPGFL